jgi:NAD(P)-dependent dehydrogenase (short-subunit alcohol dehydrogenase family)
VILVLGAGPGLGMSVAHRFGKEGYAVALVSRSASRHADYLSSLADAGVDAAAFTADAADPDSLRHAVEAARAGFGRIDVGYYGPADLGSLFGDITTLDGAGAEEALRGVVPAVEFASLLIPELTERGSGALFFAGGLSSVVPMPSLGGLALASAALRNYAITLNAALQPAGVYAGTITIGGLIDRGDIHGAMQANPDLFGDITVATLNPDDLAEIVWRLYTERTEAEAVINALAA